MKDAIATAVLISSLLSTAEAQTTGSQRLEPLVGAWHSLVRTAAQQKQ